MSKVVYTSASRVPLERLISPSWIVKDLLRHRELIVGFVRRDFNAAYRTTRLGVAWTIMNPLIMLAMFTFVFGYIFNGRFNSHSATETPVEFALALFVGLSMYNVVGQALTSGPGIILANSAYVKSLSFPVEILPVSATLLQIVNLAIALALCFAGFLLVHGYLHVTAIWLLAHIVCVTLISLGLCWFLGSLSVFVRDVPSVTGPLNTVLMFMSSVFFPVDSVPKKIAWVFKINPFAILVEQSRGEVLYGQAPELIPLAGLFVFSILMAILGYWFFIRTKPAFADVV